MSSFVAHKSDLSWFRKLLSGVLRTGGHSFQLIREMLCNVNLVNNFLRGLIEFRPRSDDIFVVSYPRSGTTLMQMLLYQLITDGEMSFSHISEVSPWFERSLALGKMTVSELDCFPSPRVFKSHLPYCWIPKGARYIYLVRDGMDVMVSYYHLYRSHLSYKGTFDDFFRRFMEGRVQYRSWFRHVAGWKAHREHSNVLFVEYERLIDSLDSCLHRVVDFCQLEPDPARFPEIKKRCSFRFMKKHEKKFDHTTLLLIEMGLEQNSFIRQGKVGAGKQTLNESQKENYFRMLGRQVKPQTIDLYLSNYLH